MLSTSSGHDRTVSAEGYPYMVLNLTVGRQQAKDKGVYLKGQCNVPSVWRLRLCDDCPYKERHLLSGVTAWRDRLLREVHMKKYDLFHSIFDEKVGLINRRAILNELSLNRHVFDTPIQKTFKTIRKYLIFTMILALFVLSSIIITRWLTWDLAEQSTISSIYHGSKQNVEKNKKEAFKKITIIRDKE